MCLAQGPQRSDAGEVRTRGPSVSSQALYHWATALPFFTLKLPWPEYFMAVKSVFDIKSFKDVKFWVEQSVLH